MFRSNLVIIITIRLFPIRSYCSCIIIVYFICISLVQFQVVLCFSIYSTIICLDLITLRFLSEACDWYMTLWSMWKSCVGKCSFLLHTLSCSEPSPCCILAALGIGSWVLAVHDCRICIGDCNLCDSGVFLYIIRLLYKSVPSSLAL